MDSLTQKENSTVAWHTRLHLLEAQLELMADQFPIYMELSETYRRLGYFELATTLLNFAQDKFPDRTEVASLLLEIRREQERDAR